MTWYYLVRGDQIIDEVLLENASLASSLFGAKAKPGDRIMVCALRAREVAFEWVSP